MDKPWVLVLTAAVWVFILILSIPVPGPTPAKITVVVDAGHGGHDSGAVVAGIQEKDINLALALKVAALSQGHPRLSVILTRSADVYVDLVERVRLAERMGAVLYLSIHANANSKTSICGVETWVDNTRRPTDPSWALAAMVQEAMCARTRAHNRGVWTQELYLRHTALPAVLVEVGYLTCPAERELLQEPTYQEAVAQGILQGILDYLGL
jgi:N-acetylmuramoyl-L-alanine amidase